MSFDWAREASLELIDLSGRLVTLVLVQDVEITRPSRNAEPELLLLDVKALFLREIVDRTKSTSNTYELVSDISSGEVQVLIPAKRVATVLSSLTMVPKPRSGDVIRIGENEFGIDSVDTLAPDGIPILYILKVMF